MALGLSKRATIGVRKDAGGDGIRLGETSPVDGSDNITTLHHQRLLFKSKGFWCILEPFSGAIALGGGSELLSLSKSYSNS